MTTTPDRQATLPPRNHQDGCPGERVERFTLKRPDNAIVVITRCVDCGGQSVVNHA